MRIKKLRNDDSFKLIKIFNRQLVSSRYCKVVVIILTFALFCSLKEITKGSQYNVNIASTKFMRFIFSIKSICCSIVLFTV